MSQVLRRKQAIDMKKSSLVRIIAFVIAIFLPSICIAQKIENVHPDISGKMINIYYDLSGIGDDQAVMIKVYMSTDGGTTYGQPLESVNGDVGIVVGPAKNRYIVWDVLSDVEELVSVNVKFKVTADLIGSDNNVPSSGNKISISLKTGLGSKGILDSWSEGVYIKGTLSLKQLRLGFRGDIFRTFREEINYVHQLVNYSDTGFYWGYSGGVVIEYDMIKDKKYSLYPFMYLGQAKVNYSYNEDYKTDEYFKYTMLGSLGIGIDIRAFNFMYLGVELEYLLSPWFDIIPSDKPDEGLDGFNLGFVIRFVLDN